MSPPFEGPYEVIGVSDVNCRLKMNRRGKKSVVVHKNRLKLYID